MDVSERLQTANDDLAELHGKKVKLGRERNRLHNHKQVFLAELQRIDLELETVETELEEVSTQCSSARWRIAHLRTQCFFQIFFQCLYHIYTLLSLILINVLYALYVVLLTAARLARTILDSQIASFSSKKDNLDDSLSWT